MMLKYDTIFIVQAATREEAYVPRASQTEHSEAYAVTRGQHLVSSGRLQRKRRFDTTDDARGQGKMQRWKNENSQRGQGRRSRCSRCYRLFHKFGSCPAIDRNCNSCGLRGHFAVVCRKKNANRIQAKPESTPEWTDEQRDKKVNNDEI